MLVIHPDQCIDCGVCELECPVNAIIPDTQPSSEKWLAFNRNYAEKWPRITQKGVPPRDAALWNDTPNKIQYLETGENVNG